MSKLPQAIEDQQAFAKLVRNMLASMEMAEDFGDNDTEEDDDSDNSERRRSAQPGRRIRIMSRKMLATTRPLPKKTRAADEQMEDGEMDGAEISDDDMSDEGDEDSETPGEMRRPNSPFDDFNEKVDYKVFTQEFDEEIAAEDLCDEAELAASAGISRQAACASAGCGRAGWPTGCSAA